MKKFLREKRGFLIKAAAALALAGILGWLALALNRTEENPDAAFFSEYGYYTAKVIGVLYDDARPDPSLEGRRTGSQELVIAFRDGPFKGETAKMDNYLTATSNIEAKVGMTVVVRRTDYGNGNISIIMYNYNRAVVLGGLTLVFAVILVAVGGKKGLMSLLGLVFTLLCLWFLLIPLVMRGYNMLLCTIAIVSVAATASLVILDGFTRKALAAVLGCVMGVAVAGICVWIVGVITPLSGYNMGEAERLLLHATFRGMKISGLLVCGVLIASLGAVMDVAMSIASSVHEMRMLNPALPAKRLFLSGMNIGKDAMGTMSNTLILALIGSSLNTFILSNAYEIPFSQLINTDFIVVELVQGIAGTIGIVLTVPFVAFVSARLMTAAAPKKL